MCSLGGSEWHAICCFLTPVSKGFELALSDGAPAPWPKPASVAVYHRLVNSPNSSSSSAKKPSLVRQHRSLFTIEDMQESPLVCNRSRGKKSGLNPSPCISLGFYPNVADGKLVLRSCLLLGKQTSTATIGSTARLSTQHRCRDATLTVPREGLHI